jgi:hypothetical protein
VVIVSDSLELANDAAFARDLRESAAGSGIPSNAGGPAPPNTALAPEQVALAQQIHAATGMNEVFCIEVRPAGRLSCRVSLLTADRLAFALQCLTNNGWNLASALQVLQGGGCGNAFSFVPPQPAPAHLLPPGCGWRAELQRTAAARRYPSGGLCLRRGEGQGLRSRSRRTDAALAAGCFAAAF